MQRLAAATMVCLVAFGLACSENSPNLLESEASPMFDTGVFDAAKLSDSHGNMLTAVVGEGRGIVNVSPEASQDGFSVETEVSVWRTRPNTIFNVKRAVDFAVDGICTSSNFVQLPLPNPGPLVTLTTSPGGAGSVHIPFALPQIPDDSKLDVHFEVSTTDLSIVLRTECFTVVVK